MTRRPLTTRQDKHPVNEQYLPSTFTQTWRMKPWKAPYQHREPSGWDE
jgi:hypothetical protein